MHACIDEPTPQRGGDRWVNYERSTYLGEQAVRHAALSWIVFNPTHILGPGDRRNWARLIGLIDRCKLPGMPPAVGVFADTREIAKAQVRAWQRQRFGQTYLLGGEQASFVDVIHRVGAMLGQRTPRGATQAPVLMAFAQLATAWSRFSGREPGITPESAALICHKLQVNSGKAQRELDYVETPLDRLLADTLEWMREQGLIGRSG